MKRGTTTVVSAFSGSHTCWNNSAVLDDSYAFLLNQKALGG